MRYTPAIGIGLGLVVVLPALGGPQQQQDLEHALSETVRALAVLTGIEKDLHTRPAEQAVELARSATEPAFGDDRSRDEQMQMLRKDVGRLQMTMDELSGSTTTGDTSSTGATTPTDGTTPLPSVTITTGMDDRLRAQLSGEPITTFTRRDGGSRGSAVPTPARAKADAAADALRQGQALLRANKPKDALIVLRAVESDVRAKYWMARSLEKLERIEEALDLYRAVSAAPDAGYLAQRATNDADFLEWKRDFAKKLESGSGTRPAGATAPKAPAAKDDGKADAKDATAPKKDAAKTQEGA